MGVLQKLTLSTDPQLEFYLYVPKSVNSDTSVFVTVHGISENFDQHATLFRPFAEQYGVILISPHFPATRFPDYQRLGGDGERADLALQSIIEEVRSLTGTSPAPFYLFGYSGGAQFTHRYSMAYPEDIARYAVGAAGWYTFPDPKYNYAQGISNPSLSGISFDPVRFLVVPGAVFVGDQDIALDDSLNQSTSINEQQGTTRYERGQNWIRAMTAARSNKGYSTPYQFTSLSGCPHSFSTCMKTSGMGTKVFQWLFGNP